MEKVLLMRWVFRYWMLLIRVRRERLTGEVIEVSSRTQAANKTIYVLTDYLTEFNS
ncbi:hypothetical protein SAMN06296273_2492 [Nitrosomonas ureae]|uniref:Uncharacterized protein n=1 Tax=Nitrosomonas ureae TaxID=44577 RepID=A0A285C150_9PROT|nr:hypothetical protein SAMN06296273_2492 [Nitrosomonas ureae]